MTSDFEQLWKQHYSSVCRVAASYEASAARQEELVQEIALAIWSTLSRIQEADSPKAFLLRIAHNKAVDHVSQSVKEPSGKGGGDSELEGLIAKQEPSQELAKNQQQQQLMASMRSLPLLQKQVLGLMLEGLSYTQIAQITGESMSNVGVLINRAKKQLTEKINGR